MPDTIYGCSGADIIARTIPGSPGGNDLELGEGVTYEAYDQMTGGTQKTGLKDLAGNPLPDDQVIPDETGIRIKVPDFQGGLWMQNVDDLAEPRWLLLPVDLAERVVALESVILGDFYELPADGIPETDLADAVVAKLNGAADAAEVEAALAALAGAIDAIPDPPDVSRFPTKDTLGGGLNGKIGQFANIPDADPADGEGLLGNGAGGYEFRQVGDVLEQFDPSTLRVVDAAIPPEYSPVQILSTGENPAVYTRPSLIVRRQAAPSLVPIPLAVAHANNQSGSIQYVEATLPEALANDDMIGIAVVVSNESGMDHLAVTYTGTGAGAGAFSLRTPQTIATTAYVIEGVAKISSPASAASKIRVTAQDASNNPVNRVHMLVAVYRLPNITLTSPRDLTNENSGNSTTTANGVGIPAFGSDPAVPDEVVIGVIGNNSGAGTVTRLFSGTNGWNDLTQHESDNGASARGLWVGYKLTSTIERVALTTVLTGSEVPPASGQWAAVDTSYKAA